MVLGFFEHGFAVRKLIRSCRSAALSTGLNSAKSWPYGSLVTIAADSDGSPLLLLSTLSDHTRNLGSDERASLLFEKASRFSNPQRGPRVSILGTISRTKRHQDSERFLSMHPEAEMYAGFGDFGFFRMRIEKAHWVGGFAASQWLGKKHIVLKASSVKGLVEAGPEIVAHMNQDHSDAIDLYARKILHRKGKGWRMVGIDPDGADLVIGRRFARLDFPEPISDSADARRQLIDLARQARR